MDRIFKFKSTTPKLVSNKCQALSDLQRSQEIAKNLKTDNNQKKNNYEININEKCLKPIEENALSQNNYLIDELKSDDFDNDWISMKYNELEKENCIIQKPVATVKPYVKEKNEINCLVNQRLSEDDDKEICLSCKCKYSSKSAKRRLIDECGHGSCYSCIVKKIPCKKCETKEEELEDIQIDFEQLAEIEKKALEKREKDIKTNKQNRKDLEVEKKTKKDQKLEETVINFQREDEDDEDLCVIEEFDFDSIDTKNRNDQMLNNQQTKGVYIPDIERYEKINWLFNDIKDCSYQFRSTEYEHTDEMLTIFRNSFGLKHFRPQQFEAVNAALLGINVFILMPTGGGKSLCYQLPAVISKGVTFVISPLKSLIIDQVQKLNALGLSACHMLSDADSSAECDNVYKELVKQEPKYKLVYITPEKLNNSSKLRNVVMNLYNRGMIARLVIDEAHCVSQWGHDFRTDYKKIGELRFTLMPNVPCMLLTATATPRVRNDILMQMKLSVSETASVNKSAFKSAFVTNVQNNQMNKLETKLNNRHYMSVSMNSLPANNQQCVFFMQSFNRENLQYQVEYKTSNAAALEKISDLIKSKYANKSGIVYCISRNECEQVSEYLRKKQIKALPYHAGMDDQKRQQIQHKWTNNIDCKVVCATIAFGMGIDKPDVQYVIHLSLPKSLEGYYQESGRAGRDGSKALCVLFYNNQDRQRWLRIISAEIKNKNSIAYETHVDNVRRVAQYCDNQTDCRRAQILEYFGEIFNREKCIRSKMNTICDNCKLLETKKSKSIDMTEKVKFICNSIKHICLREDITLLHLADILKGSFNSKIVEKNHHTLEFHSKMDQFKKCDIERLLRKLVFSGYLKEELKVIKSSEIVACYVRPGPKISEIFARNFKFEFELIEDEIMPKKNSTCYLDYESQHSDDSDVEEILENNESLVKEKNSKDFNLILGRCKSELKRLIKSLGIEHKIDNVNLIFTRKMIQEMLTQLPTDKEALLGITGYTEAIFNNYKGNEFLKIFQHYSNLKASVNSKDTVDFSARSNLKSSKSKPNNDHKSDKWLNSKDKAKYKRKACSNEQSIIKSKVKRFFR
uniref:DNA 3'-5' helicase n=2 Tax=Brachionus koreanus TaxID=1199090 RepID=A0A7G7WNJ4_9BILA|nr:Bloom Syndrome protein 2 [Brachionus koreanus]